MALTNDWHWHNIYLSSVLCLSARLELRCFVVSQHHDCDKSASQGGKKTLRNQSVSFLQQHYGYGDRCDRSSILFFSIAGTNAHR
jgi:hypothetical protein